MNKLFGNMLQLNRLYLFLSIVLVATLVFFLGAGGDFQQQKPKERISKVGQVPDFFISRSMSQVFNTTGELHYTVEATRTDHFENVTTTTFAKPLIEMYRHGEKAWQISSVDGSAYNQGERIELRKDVVIKELQDAPGPLTLETPALDYFPDREYAETNQAVIIRTGKDRTNAIGMKAYLDKDQLQLLSTVRGIHGPR